MSGTDERPERMKEERSLDSILLRAIENNGRIIMVTDCLNCHFSDIVLAHLGENASICCKIPSVVENNGGLPRFVSLLTADVPVPDWCPLLEAKDYLGYLMQEYVVRQVRELMPEFT